MIQEYHNLLNNPQFYVEDITQYPKQIQESIQLKEEGYTAFSFIDIIWLGLVTDLVKHLSISNSEIATIKKDLFVELDSIQGIKLTTLEYHIIKILKDKSKYYLLLDQNKQCLILDYYNYCDRIAKDIDVHVTLSLNQQIYKCFGESLGEQQNDNYHISGVEQQIVEIIRKHRFTDMRIRTKYGKIERVYLKEVLPVNTDLEYILKQNKKNQRIEVEQQNGKVLHVTRTKKIKIKYSDGKTAKLL